MISKEGLEKIRKITKEFFQKTTFDVSLDFSTQEENTLLIEVKTEDPQILIGERGQTLADIQHLLKIILRKKTEELFYINVDINDYKKKKAEYLKELANSVADDVVLTKKEKALSPMRAFERRIVHMELAERSGVITESIGERDERKVVVKPS
jgi:spoIIIJ-associated protein